MLQPVVFPYLFDSYEYQMDLCDELCLAGWPSWCGKKYNVRHNTQSVQPNFSIPAMLTGIIDFYNFILLSQTLTLLGDHKVSANIGFIFFPHFSTDQDEILCCDEAIQAEQYETIFE